MRWEGDRESDNVEDRRGAGGGGGFGFGGGTVGIGTIVFAISIGPALEAGFWLLRRSPVGVPPPLATPEPAPLVGS